jgi:hypothetical protein
MIPDWVEEVEQDVRACCCDGRAISPREIAARLGISERSAVSYICLLASEGRVTIERVSPATWTGKGGDAAHAVPAGDRVDRSDR